MQLENFPKYKAPVDENACEYLIENEVVSFLGSFKYCDRDWNAYLTKNSSFDTYRIVFVDSMHLRSTYRLILRMGSVPRTLPEHFKEVLQNSTDFRTLLTVHYLLNERCLTPFRSMVEEAVGVQMLQDIHKLLEQQQIELYEDL